MDFLDAVSYQMVRDLNVLLANATDDEIRPFIQYHAVPRVRYRMLTATDTLGRQVFYGRITDLSQPEVQRAAELLLDQVLAVDIIVQGVRQIVAKLACSMMTTQIAAQLEAQRDYGKILEKQAMKDLDDLVRSPVLGGVVTAIRATVVEKFQAQSFGLALDMDPDSLDRAHAAVKPYDGAQANGEVRLYMDGTPLVVQVRSGDLPAQILRKLSLLSVQYAGDRRVELISMDQTAPVRSFAKVLSVDEVTYPVKINVAVTEAKLQSRTSSGVLASIASMSLVRYVGGKMVPGIPGLVLGYGADYSSLQPTLNPVVLGDIKNADFILPTDPSVGFNPSDILAFTSLGALAATRDDGSPNVLKYKVSQIATGGNANLPQRGGTEVSISVVDGWTPLDLVEAIAKDLGRRRASQNLLGAVLPSVAVTAGGAVVNAPALDLVGYSADQDLEVKFLFQLTQLPQGVQTVVATRSLEAPAFDETLDSVVVSAITLGRTEVVQLDAQGMGGARAAEAVTSNPMSDVLAKIRRMIDTGR